VGVFISVEARYDLQARSSSRTLDAGFSGEEARSMSELRREIRTITLNIRGKVAIVEQVPVLVDPFTDEVLLEEPVARRVLDLVDATPPVRLDQTPVYAF